MKKRILAIFLCLILAVSLATAVAAKNDVITPGGTYIIVPDNPSQPGPDYTPVPNDTTMTLQIPIGKVVTLGGNTAPQRTTFTFDATPSNERYGSSDTGLWEVQNCTVSVSGEGAFNCVMTIRIEQEDLRDLTDLHGIFITETYDEQPGWTYDKARWFLQPQCKWSDAAQEYKWTGGWNCYNKFEVTEDGVLFDRDNAKGGLGFVNTYTENTYKTATLNKTDHFAFLKGYPGGGFAPGKNMSRAEVTTMFARLLTEQIEADKTYSSTFNDVAKNCWAANYIGYMQQFGIVTGYTDGSFRPNAPVTRAEFAAIASRFEKLTQGSANFTDVPDTHWAVRYINFAATRGWVTGYEDGTFKPEHSITRAEVAAVTCRLLERSADQTYIRSHIGELRTFADVTESHWAYWYAMEAANGHDYTKSGASENWSRTHR